MPQPSPELTPLDAAVGYADDGIPILPYQVPSLDQRHHPDHPPSCAACRRPDCSAPPLHPTGRLDQYASARHLAHVGRWWATNPQAGIAVAAGIAFDVIELHTTLAAETILAWLADQHCPVGPVLHAGHGRLQLLTQPDSYQHDRIDRAAATILYLAPGARVLLPPSRLADGQPVTWLRPLDALTGLPDGTELFWMLAELPASRQPADRHVDVFPPSARQRQHQDGSAW